MAARAGEVLDDARLGVEEALHLEQRRRSAHLVARARAAQHQALAAERLHAAQLGAQVVDAGAALVRVVHGVRRLAPLELRAAEGEAVLEGRAEGGGVEDDERDLLPVVALVLPAHHADGALEALAPAPQLAVEGHGGQAGHEPIGRVVAVAEAREELLPVPVGAHPVELLAHPPAGEVLVVVPGVGEEDGRALLRGLPGGAGLRGGGGERAADAGDLGGLAAQRLEVLAGSLLDPQRLVAPRGAGAGVHLSDVAQHVARGSRALYLDRFAVLEIRHDVLRDG